MSTVVHIEIDVGEHKMMCGLTIPPPGASVTYTAAIASPGHDFVSLDDWQTRSGKITRVTCRPCRDAMLNSGWRVARQELEADEADKAKR